MRRALPLCAGLVACMAISGCGGSSKPKAPAKPAVDPLIAKTATPQATVKLIYANIIGEHPAAACQLVTPRGQRQFVKIVGGAFKLTTCLATANQISGFANGTRVGRVVQKGDTATVHVRVGNAVPATVELIKTPLGWRMDGFRT